MISTRKPKLTKSVLKKNLSSLIVLCTTLLLFYGILHSVSKVYEIIPTTVGPDLSSEIQEMQRRRVHKDNLSLIHQNITLDKKTEAILVEALFNEYLSEATYQNVVNVFGEISPFTNVTKLETRHSSNIEALFELYGLKIPVNPYAEGKGVPQFNSYLEACTKTYEAEVKNIEMYNRLLETIKPADIRLVFTNNKFISENNHLPAFQRCSSIEQQ